MQLSMIDDDDEFNPSESGLEMGASIDSETHDDVDPFEELGIGSRVNASSTEENGSRGYDALSDLVDDEEEEGVEPEPTNQNDVGKTEATYVMLLQTVWVDGILDPAEVRLLAKKRIEMNISFERHLELVEDLIG